MCVCVCVCVCFGFEVLTTASIIAAGFRLISCLAYSLTLKMEAMYS
jgi:hypothetical protein